MAETNLMWITVALMHRLIAVSSGVATPIATKSGLTGHFKAAQPSVRIGTFGVAGDEIVDKQNHGGPEQAIYLLGEADRAWWEADLGKPVPPGFMGENLLIDGMASCDLALGDILELGEVRLQITAPRVPCVTFAARVGDPQAIRRFATSRHPGAYARVLRGGDLIPGQTIRHLPYGGDCISVTAHLDAYLAGLTDPAYLRRLLTVPAHAALHRIAQERLAQDVSGPI